MTTIEHDDTDIRLAWMDIAADLCREEGLSLDAALDVAHSLTETVLDDFAADWDYWAAIATITNSRVI